MYLGTRVINRYVVQMSNPKKSTSRQVLRSAEHSVLFRVLIKYDPTRKMTAKNT